MDGFSARKIEYGSILKDFYDFGLFGTSPAGPTWDLSQVDLGSARPKPTTSHAHFDVDKDLDNNLIFLSATLKGKNASKLDIQNKMNSQICLKEL